MQVNVGNFNFQPRTAMMQSEAGDEFDRATEPPESEESYYYEEAENNKIDSEGSEEGFYMPTLIHKNKTTIKKGKKKKRVTSPKITKKPPTKANIPHKSPDSARGGS